MIPRSATNAEKWILFVLEQLGDIKPTASECGVTVRRVQQVVAKYNVELVKTQSFSQRASKALEFAAQLSSPRSFTS